MEKTILILEDDKDILDVMVYILEGEGFRVISTQESVSTAFVRKLRPALILLDNRLADGFGYDLCLSLKNDPSTCCFPVVLVSATNRLPELAETSLADAYLNKPFDLGELVRLVRRYA
ncbi:response regulator transcription factor [Mucilaginibacter segetis]|uniref:Response regulator n=1 Tax=Mucilaginibacter segetis TaxID=2793071 RepID=A0A934PRV9_9SPHI|nr:response regulator [Mucilaginibacter segetis]MBK0378497.1 response regulator [Mucilaginibacter segetis]